ncbi:MAG: hypothetical protein FWG97_04485, partial [Deltaproteobacteria bacterium]|nr:hypothetical protein [Deltaproteobacteria bacterium]
MPGGGGGLLICRRLALPDLLPPWRPGPLRLDLLLTGLGLLISRPWRLLLGLPPWRLGASLRLNPLVTGLRR